MPPSSEERERYTRQLGVAGWGSEGQSRLRSARVFIAGAGGLGSAASFYLATAGIGRLTICDEDRVELSNLNRQILYRSGDVGGEKAPLASTRLTELNPHVEVRPVTARIDNRSAPELITGSHLVLDCLDNLETRLVLNRAAATAGIPMIYAAVSEFTGYLSFLHPPMTPCLQCFLPHDREVERPAIPGCTPGVLGALEAMEAVKFLTGAGENLTSRLLIIEGAEPRFDIVRIEKDPDCVVCRGLR